MLSEIYTLKGDDEHPRPFHVGVPPRMCPPKLSKFKDNWGINPISRSIFQGCALLLEVHLLAIV